MPETMVPGQITESATAPAANKMQVIAWQLRLRGQTTHSNRFIYVLPGWWAGEEACLGCNCALSAATTHVHLCQLCTLTLTEVCAGGVGGGGNVNWGIIFTRL